jgi:HEAT repeat protein
MQSSLRTIAILSMALVAMISGTQVCMAVDPLRVLLLAVHDPELNPDWGVEGSTPSLQYTPERFASSDNEIVLVALEACQRARLRGFVVPDEWIVACRNRLAAGESFPRLRGELVQFLLKTNNPGDAELLWKATQADTGLSLAVEERLMEWNSTLALDAWRNRLKETTVTKDRLLVAVQGIAKLGSSDDVAQLEGLLRNRKQPLSVRYVAAQGIARIDNKKALELLDEVAAGTIRGDVALSDQKADAGPVWDYWLATTYLIGTHETDRTKELLIEALKKGSDVARAVALRQLGQMSVDEFKKQLSLVRNDPEINVRLEVLEFLSKHVDEEAIVILGEYLGDDQPRVREMARDVLLKLADVETQRPVVEREVSKALKSEKWWQVEQALIAAASLGMKNEEQQFLVLLDHKQAEVYVTAAWALRVLAHSPEVISKMVEIVNSDTDRFFGDDSFDEPVYHRTAHLIEGLSVRKVPEARASIARYVPKNQKAGLASRMSALWGMGKYLRDKPEQKFSDAYIVIIYDKMGFGAEFGIMRYCAMIGLGNMADPYSKAKIVELEEGEASPMALAKGWALEQIEKREQELKAEKQ